MTEEGQNMGVTYQMADISQPLNSVGRICDQDNAVLFTKFGGFVINLFSGERTRFRREDGVYLMRSWVRKCPPTTSPPRSSCTSGFPRQG